LEAKGYINGRLKGRTRVYTAKVKPRTVIREMEMDYQAAAQALDRLVDQGLLSKG
jgi:sugar-specific transcriptional regulator TrmB